MTTKTEADKLAGLIAGLRELADWYEQHPDVPLPLYPSFIHCVHSDDDQAGTAELAAVAEALAVEQSTHGGHPAAERVFGAVEFRVYYVPRVDAAEYQADRKLLARVKAEQDARCESCGEPLRLIANGTVGHCGDEHGNDCPAT
jgi:hypothetical protein